jgi:hypothetical protein
MEEEAKAETRERKVEDGLEELLLLVDEEAVVVDFFFFLTRLWPTVVEVLPPLLLVADALAFFIEGGLDVADYCVCVYMLEWV